ncbi:MAG: hypothetical protein HUU60_08400 [Armatimonadetes bacterium]|nr:hypothetical protein [Armatimonadota bacterium]
MRLWNQFSHWWGLTKQLSPKAIEAELNATFKIALVGQHDRTESVWRVLTEGAGADALRKAEDYVHRTSIYANGDYDAVIECDQLEVPQDAIERLIIDLHKKEFPLIAVARILPGTREIVANKVIEESSQLNAGIAMLSAVPSVVPLLGLLAPPAALADMALLTKNQLMMVLRVAASYGKEADWKKRLPELGSVIGSAFGWRAIARELVGFVPGGVGVVLKGMVAYAGTSTIGRAAAWFYATGRAPGKAERERLYEQAWREAREKSKEWKEPKP